MSVLFEKIPCWYELSWDRQLGIIIRVHTEFIDKSIPILSDAPIITHLKEKMGFMDCSIEIGKDFGFNGALPFIGKDGDFLQYLIPCHPSYKQTNEKCERCDGLGINRGLTCFGCNGSKKNRIFDNSKSYAVSASLTLLSRWLKYPTIETSSKKPQLMVVSTFTAKEACGGAIDCELGADVVKFLKNRPNGSLENMLHVMKSTWSVIDGGLRDYHQNNFSAYTQGSDGWLNISCPGQGCGLNPDSDIGRSDTLGYSLAPHNVDSPDHQITLLASLAALHDLVRRGGS